MSNLISRVYIDWHIKAFKCEHLKCTQSFRYASDLKKHDIVVHLIYSGLKVKELIATESLGGRIGIIYQDTAAYTTYIIQDHS